MQDRLTDWFRSFYPTPLTAPPKEWLRAGIGVALVLAMTLPAGIWLFGVPATLHLAGPVGASAFLLFAASSSPFARPWPVLVGNTIAALIGISIALSELGPVPGGLLAGSLTLICLFVLRCLHPPSCALALVTALGGADLQAMGYGVLLPVLMNSVLLIAAGLVYNNLTGHPYPKSSPPRDNTHHTRDPLPSERLSFTHDDVDRALREFGEYVDITRDDLERLIKQTEKHALRRSMGEITAADIMSRDLYWSGPDVFIEHAWKTLQQHRLRSLPVLDGDSRRLIGIVTLVDLLKHFQPRPTRISFGQLKYLRGTKLRAVMSSPVVSVRADTHMVELVYLLSDRGLHCLPVVDDQERLIGMVTQTDLIAALYANWLKHLPD
ncbi:HPP family protein [Stutzerimonas urumqiensis]|uniref:HPP family protein n=1 Tax=Stutzerimonas urumqiensis TaxID=638269 RepID=UPI000EB31AF6|nr:CBS domain-containing protein [Stutzerimonas urumqiensis]